MFRSAIILLTLQLLAAGTAWADDDQPPRQVNVNGSAVIMASPDQATLRLGIQSRNKDLQAAREQVARVAGDFLQLTRKLGIDESQVQTTGLSLRPEYRWDREAQKQDFAGYFVQRSLQVELKDIELLGELIEGAVNTGVNEVSPPVLGSSRRQELEREAMALAAKDAQANAQVLATALKAKLGQVRQISAMDSRRPPAPVAMRAMAMEADSSAAPTYQTGDIRFESRVNASFDLD
ncbi:MAG: SIMPL domain-containing protein [Gammaproteobacteria bacterium]